MNVSLAKQFALLAAKTDLKGFCEWNRMDRATGMRVGTGPMLNEYRRFKGLGDRDGAAQVLVKGDRNFMESSVISPWSLSLMGHPALKRIPYRSPFYSVQSSNCFAANWCADEMIKALSRTGLNEVFGAGSAFKTLSEGDNISNKAASEWKTEILGACLRIDILGARGCLSAAEELFTSSYLVVMRAQGLGGGRTIGAPLVEKVLEEPRLSRPLKATAIKLWTRIKNKDFSKDAEIFEDLKAEISASGFSADDANLWAIRVLGAISTGGPNFYTRVMTPDGGDLTGRFPENCALDGCNMSAVAMAAIAEGLVHADTLKMERFPSSSPYTLPSHAQFSCDSGKWYHFWMPAAFVAALMERGHSANAAKAAVFVSHLGYHLRPPDGGRKRDLLNTLRFGSIENGIRIDMTLAAAGSHFGSIFQMKNASENLEIQEAFVKMMQAGATNPSLEITDRRAKQQQLLSEKTDIFKWFDNLAPKTAYDFYK